jgi:hypothetical protein
MVMRRSDLEKGKRLKRKEKNNTLKKIGCIPSESRSAD